MSAMIDHISLRCRDITRARAFYDAVLAPLGYRRLFDFNDTSGYGVEHIPGSAISFWIGQASDGTALSGHLCFRAPSRAAVDAFHRAALAAGGTDNGAPGLRPHYHKDYYGAFVLDFDGYNIEAVCHTPE